MEILGPGLGASSGIVGILFLGPGLGLGIKLGFRASQHVLSYPLALTVTNYWCIQVGEARGSFKEKNQEDYIKYLKQ